MQLRWADIHQQRLLHSERLAPDSMDAPALGRCSLALSRLNGSVQVLAVTGPEAGRQLFVGGGRWPAFDPVLGVHLAVMLPGGGLAVLHGTSGAQLARWSPVEPYTWTVSHSWLPDASGHVQVRRGTAGARAVLRFGACM